jgi:hypothetical protein
MLVAKPVIDKQFWILQDGQQKVGNIEACAGGYQVKINNQIAQFKTIRMAARQVNIEFEQPTRRKPTKSATAEVHGYPAAGKVNNPMWDLKLRAPIYTRNNKSKSWYAAGWYRIKKGRHWTAVQDPKLIVLQRYPYQGPYHSEQECNDADACAKIC